MAGGCAIRVLLMAHDGANALRRHQPVHYVSGVGGWASTGGGGKSVTLTAKIRGYGSVIDDLQKAGVVKERDAGFAKVGLDLMAGQPADFFSNSVR